MAECCTTIQKYSGRAIQNVVRVCSTRMLSDGMFIFDDRNRDHVLPWGSPRLRASAIFWKRTPVNLDAQFCSPTGPWAPIPEAEGCTTIRKCSGRAIQNVARSCSTRMLLDGMQIFDHRNRVRSLPWGSPRLRERVIFWKRVPPSLQTPVNLDAQFCSPAGPWAPIREAEGCTTNRNCSGRAIQNVVRSCSTRMLLDGM